MNIKCLDDIDNETIIKNKDKFEDLHTKNKSNYLKPDFDDIIYIPTIINICLTNEKYSIDFIKYCKYIIDVLNDGFSGNIKSKYKSYSKEQFKNLLKSQSNGETIYNYINNTSDTKIRFVLKSIIYHNKNFEYNFCDKNTNTDALIKNFYSNGFFIKNEYKYDLNINIIKFNCDTLGVSTFPWVKHILNKHVYPMLVFIDYKTIHPDVSKNRFNKCRTLIHEVGHIFGLKHIFSCHKDSLLAYKIILGTEYYNKIFNPDNQPDINLNSKVDEIIKLYPDVPIQKLPTVQNPIEKNKFEINNGVPVNFACFMDYSPDEVLTHFTKSQILVMRNIINIFKPKLISNAKNININESIKLELPEGYILDFNNKNVFQLKNSQLINSSFIYKIRYLDDYYEKYGYKINKQPIIIDNNKNRDLENIENNSLLTFNILKSIINNI